MNDARKQGNFVEKYKQRNIRNVSYICVINPLLAKYKTIEETDQHCGMLTFHNHTLFNCLRNTIWEVRNIISSNEWI